MLVDCLWQTRGAAYHERDAGAALFHLPHENLCKLLTCVYLSALGIKGNHLTAAAGTFLSSPFDKGLLVAHPDLLHGNKRSESLRVFPETFLDPLELALTLSQDCNV